MTYYGDFETSALVHIPWDSVNSSGASVTRATNGTISVYKDAGTTQSTTGVTDTEDFDGLTGIHWITIDLSSDGTFYSAGSNFSVVLSAATIDGQTVNAVLGAFSIRNRSALMPTTVGRKLDVSAGGEAGVDWANVGSPTTTVGLSGTTVKTATDVETDTADIQTRLPAALVSGRIDASVGAMAADVVTATAIATDAIGSAELAASAVTEIQSGLATSAALATAQTDLTTILARIGAFAGSGLNTILGVLRALGAKAAALTPTDLSTGTTYDNTTDSLEASADTQATAAALATVQADTDDIQGRLPAALVSGRIDASVGAMAADVVTSTAIATDAIGSAELAASAVTEIQSGLATAAALTTAQTDLDDIQTRLPATLVSGRIDASVGAIATGAIAAASFTAGAIDAAAVAADAANEIADALLDRAAGVETNRTPRQAFRLMLAALAGKLSGAATTTVLVRDTNDTKDRITATVDANGNRTAVTLDGT